MQLARASASAFFKPASRRVLFCAWAAAMSFSISQNFAAQPRCAEQSVAACAGIAPNMAPNMADAAAAVARDLTKEGMRCLRKSFRQAP
ncbi:hypothetical protein D3C71_1778360 [compost metagenome]